MTQAEPQMFDQGYLIYKRNQKPVLSTTHAEPDEAWCKVRKGRGSSVAQRGKQPEIWWCRGRRSCGTSWTSSAWTRRC